MRTYEINEHHYFTIPFPKKNLKKRKKEEGYFPEISMKGVALFQVKGLWNDSIILLYHYNHQLLSSLLLGRV